MTGEAPFYVGYVPTAPPQLAGKLLRIASALLLLGAAIATLLLFCQSPFSEFQQYRDYEGVLEPWPYPTLVTKEGKCFTRSARQTRSHPGNRRKVGSLEGGVNPTRLGFHARAVAWIAELDFQMLLIRAPSPTSGPFDSGARSSTVSVTSV